MKACVFDLDGTLLDSLEDLADACNATLRHNGYPEHPLEPYRYFVGNGIDMLLRRALPEGEAERLGEVAFKALVDQDREIYGRSWHVKSRLYAGIEDMLHGLVQHGVKLAVLSNKPHGWTEEIMRHYCGAFPFAVIRGAVSGVPHKPDATAALQVAAELGLAPSQCYFVGDTRVDMETAVNAGMTPVGVTWGFREEAELREFGARYIVHEASALLHLKFS